MLIPQAVVQQGTSYWSTTIVKQADETISASTTLQNDNEFFFSVSANAIYEFAMTVYYTSNGTADFKHAFATSTGNFLQGCNWRKHNGIGPTTGLAQNGLTADATTAISNASGAAGENVPGVVMMTGVLSVDADAVITYQWAQNASDPGNTAVKAGSTFSARNLSRLSY